MLRLAVSAGNTEYKHMVVSAGRTQTRNQIDGMDRWTAGWICRRIDGNGSVDLWTDGWETMFVLSSFPKMVDSVYPRCYGLMDALALMALILADPPPLPYARLLQPVHLTMASQRPVASAKPASPAWSISMNSSRRSIACPFVVSAQSLASRKMVFIIFS